jgi:four helix bundle protein
LNKEITYEIENQLITIAEPDGKYAVDLREKLFNFAAETIRFLMILPGQMEFDVFRNQLSKSATSIGANYEESQASTYKESLHKIKIALREANETIYWLRIIEKMNISEKEQNVSLINEATEISLILGSIASKVDNKLKDGK